MSSLSTNGKKPMKPSSILCVSVVASLGFSASDGQVIDPVHISQAQEHKAVSGNPAKKPGVRAPNISELFSPPGASKNKQWTGEVHKVAPAHSANTNPSQDCTNTTGSATGGAGSGKTNHCTKPRTLFDKRNPTGVY